MLLTKIRNCARCKGVHLNVEAMKLTHPVLEDEPSDKVLFTHWLPCPTNGEPILVVQVEKS